MKGKKKTVKKSITPKKRTPEKLVDVNMEEKLKSEYPGKSDKLNKKSATIPEKLSNRKKSRSKSSHGTVVYLSYEDTDAELDIEGKGDDQLCSPLSSPDIPLSRVIAEKRNKRKRSSDLEGENKRKRWSTSSTTTSSAMGSCEQSTSAVIKRRSRSSRYSFRGVGPELYDGDADESCTETEDESIKPVDEAQPKKRVYKKRKRDDITDEEKIKQLKKRQVFKNRNPFVDIKRKKKRSAPKLTETIPLPNEKGTMCDLVQDITQLSDASCDEIIHVDKPAEINPFLKAFNRNSSDSKLNRKNSTKRVKSCNIQGQTAITSWFSQYKKKDDLESIENPKETNEIGTKKILTDGNGKAALMFKWRNKTFIKRNRTPTTKEMSYLNNTFLRRTLTPQKLRKNSTSDIEMDSPARRTRQAQAENRVKLDILSPLPTVLSLQPQSPKIRKNATSDIEMDSPARRTRQALAENRVAPDILYHLPNELDIPILSPKLDKSDLTMLRSSPRSSPRFSNPDMNACRSPPPLLAVQDNVPHNSHRLNLTISSPRLSCQGLVLKASPNNDTLLPISSPCSDQMPALNCNWNGIPRFSHLPILQQSNNLNTTESAYGDFSSLSGKKTQTIKTTPDRILRSPPRNKALCSLDKIFEDAGLVSELPSKEITHVPVNLVEGNMNDVQYIVAYVNDSVSNVMKGKKCLYGSDTNANNDHDEHSANLENEPSIVSSLNIDAAKHLVN